jgi:hypothetical protein
MVHLISSSKMMKLWILSILFQYVFCTYPHRVHLVVAVHGLMGHGSDWNRMETAIQRAHKDLQVDAQLFILKSKSNEGKTFSGLYLQGNRVAREVIDFVQDEMASQLQVHEDFFIYVSFLGHSLGGLNARFAIGELFFPHHQAQSLESTVKDVFKNAQLKPFSYLSIATPHLGSRRPFYEKSGIYNHVFRHGLHFGIKMFNAVGKTGHELMLNDDWNYDGGNDGKKQVPIIIQLADPTLRYFQALAKFKYHTLVSAVHDHIVPTCTSSIRSEDPLKEREDCPWFGRRHNKQKPLIRIAVGFSRKTRRWLSEQNFVSFHPLSHRDANRGTGYQTGGAICDDDQCPEEPCRDCHQNAKEEGPKFNRHVKKLFGRKSHFQNTKKLQFHPQSMENLQRLGWRRLIFDFQLPFHQRFGIHNRAIGKDPRKLFPGPNYKEMGSKPATVIAHVVGYDIDSEIKALKGRLNRQ